MPQVDATVCPFRRRVVPVSTFSHGNKLTWQSKENLSNVVSWVSCAWKNLEENLVLAGSGVFSRQA